MKRAAAVLLTLALMLSFTACMSRGSMQLKRADRYFDDLRGAFKMSDVTNSAKLIGKRENNGKDWFTGSYTCLLYTSPSPRDLSTSRMPSSA